MKISDCSFKVEYSEEDKEYVGTCDKFPSLSWLEPKPEKALVGIYRLALDVIKDMENE